MWRKATDIELCSLAQRGDRAAESEIVERYRPLAGYAATDNRVPGMEPGDLFSCALLAILKAVRSYKDERLQFARYARLLISREIVSAARKVARTPRRGVLTYGEEPVEIEEFVLDEREATDGQALVESSIELIMEQLTPEERIVLQHRMRGESESFISREMKCSRIVVRARMQRIRDVAGPILDYEL